MAMALPRWHHLGEAAYVALLHEFWKSGGVLRVSADNEQLIKQLIKSKVFTSIVVGGDDHRDESGITPLLKPLVPAGRSTLEHL